MNKGGYLISLVFLLAACNNNAEVKNADTDSGTEVNFGVDSTTAIPDSGKKGPRQDNLKDTLPVKFPDKKE